MVLTEGPMRMAASSSATVFGECVAGDRRRRSGASRAGRARARAATGRSWDRADARRGRSTAHRRGDRSSPAACRIRSVDFHAAIQVHGADAEAVVAKRLERQRPARAAPRQTSSRPGVSSCRGYACRPSALPNYRGTLAPRRAIRSAARGAAFSSRAPRPLRLCPCGRDRRRDTAARRRHSARVRRGRAD